MTSHVPDVVMVHPTAEVAPTARVGAGTRIWHQAQVADGVTIGQHCTIGKGAYIGVGSVLGSRVKVQNGCGVFGAHLEDDTMLAPGVYLLEDPVPRATNPDGQTKTASDWRPTPVTVRQGATVGANAVVAPGVTVGSHAMIALGAVVHRDVPAHALVAGNPARQVGWVCHCGARLEDALACGCGRRYRLTGTRLSPA